jgi:hypothetical protein
MYKNNIVTCFEGHVSEVSFPKQQILDFVGNRFVQAHIHGNAHAKETELVEMFPLRSFHSCLSSGFKGVAVE